MYSLKTLVNQEPSRITAAFGQILTTVGVLGWSPLTDQQNLAIVGTLNTVLVLLYIAPRVVSAGKLDEIHDAQLEAIDLGKQLAPPMKAAPVKAAAKKAAK